MQITYAATGDDSTQHKPNSAKTAFCSAPARDHRHRRCTGEQTEKRSQHDKPKIVLLRNASQHVQHVPMLPKNRKWAMKLPGFLSRACPYF
jgi:hypothetical protein